MRGRTFAPSLFAVVVAVLLLGLCSQHGALAAGAGDWNIG